MRSCYCCCWRCFHFHSQVPDVLRRERLARAWLTDAQQICCGRRWLDQHRFKNREVSRLTSGQCARGPAQRNALRTMRSYSIAKPAPCAACSAALSACCIFVFLLCPVSLPGDAFCFFLFEPSSSLLVCGNADARSAFQSLRYCAAHCRCFARCLSHSAGSAGWLAAAVKERRMILPMLLQ